jgi:DNA-binding response OmpR family regulator
MASAPIIIVSDDKDFTSVIAEQVSAELGVPCHEATLQELNDKTISDYTLVVSDRPVSAQALVVSAKPLRVQDMLAQIEELLHKASVPESRSLSASYCLRGRQKQLMHETTGKSVDITDKEMQLLLALADAGTSGMRRELLLKRVWGFESPEDTHTLETHVYRLRSKIKELSGDDSLIVATDGGYKMAAL